MFSRSRWLAVACFLVYGAAPQAWAQDVSGRARDSVAKAQAAYASTRAPQYLPLETVRSGTVRMPEQLARRVSVKLDAVPLQRVLMEIATQAGLGLSYGEDLVRAAPTVSVDIAGRSAADALASAVAGTRWMVLVTATGQVTVNRADVLMVGVINGRVTDRATSQPIEGVQITVDGTRLGAETSSDGRYTIGGVTAGAQHVTVRRLGYDVQTQIVMVSDGATQTLNFALGRAAVALSQVVVTATGEERTREVGNSLTVVDLSNENAPIANTQELLTGRVPGVTVLGNSGQAGSGGTIRLRGVNSISQGNSPIIYVDGVRMSGAHTPTSVGGRQDVSPLNDIDMTDVDHVEVVKGPAATTLYGTEASGGVIQIFTKHGKKGSAQGILDASTGFNNMGHIGVASDTTGMFVNKCSGVLSIGDGTKFQDATCPASGSWLSNGQISRYSLGVRGSNDSDDYYLSGNLNDEHSVLQTGNNRTAGVRGNISVHATPTLTLSLNSTFVKRDVRWYPDGLSSNAFLLNVSRGPGTFFKGSGCSDPTVVCILNDSIFTINNTTNTNHFITGGTATYTPIPKLSVRMSAGYDYDVADITDITPFGHLRVPLGSIAETQWNRTLITLDLAATLRHSLGRAFESTTSFGGQTFDSRLNQTDLSSSNFSAPGVPTLTSGSLRNIVGQNEQRVINAGYFAQEMIGWRDILFVTGGFRVDGNSAFGTGFGLQTYPKVSASYVISDEKFWPSRFIETLKLRAAVGESGKAPGAFDAVRTWDPVAAENGQSAFEPSQVGNPSLGPERTREVEGGFDASMFNGKMSLSYSYYTTRTNGALVPVTLPPSLGFAARQLENVGILRNNGSEIAVNVDVLKRRSAELSAGVQFTMVRSEAGDVGGQTITVDANSLSFVQQGYAAPSYFGDRVTNPTALADPVVEHNAFLGATFPTSIITPRVTLRLLNRVSFDAIGEFQRGGHLLNSIGFANEGLFTWQPCFDTQAKLRLAAAGNTSALADVTALDRARCSIDSKVKSAGFWVERADFFKLRSLSMTYSLPDRVLGSSNGSSVTLSARNLFKNTPYTGTDPESADQLVSSFARRDYYVFPAPRTFLVSIHTGF
ncbi:MAG: TonB-dependent receptor [bacterium]